MHPLFLLALAQIPVQPVPDWRPLPHPCIQDGLRENARFGTAVQMLDFDADSFLDLAVGAGGEGTVYVFRGDGQGNLAYHSTLRASGPVPACPQSPAGDGFGHSLAAAPSGVQPGDALVVGAPLAAAMDGRVYVFVFDSTSGWRRIDTLVSHPQGLAGRLGESVAAADLDADGIPDVAAGAPYVPRSEGGGGNVHIFLSSGPEIRLENPRTGMAGAELGVFGIHLDLGDVDGAGGPDLVVGAEGNPPVPLGSLHVFLSPFASASIDLDDPQPCPGEITVRFGKWVAAGGGWVLTGAPQKDDRATCAIQRVGGAFLFRYDPSAGTPPFRAVQLNGASENGEELLGARCILSDRVGNGLPDFVYVPWGQGLHVWDGEDPSRPVTKIPRPGGIGIHWVHGIDTGQLVPGGRQEIAVGSAEQDAGGYSDSGQVWILF